MNPMAPESTFNPLPLKMFLSSTYQPRVSADNTAWGKQSRSYSTAPRVFLFAQYLTHTHTGAGSPGDEICANRASCPLPYKIRKNTTKTAILPKERGISHPAPFPAPLQLLGALCWFAPSWLCP